MENGSNRVNKHERTGSTFDLVKEVAMLVTSEREDE